MKTSPLLFNGLLLFLIVLILMEEFNDALIFKNMMKSNATKSENNIASSNNETDNSRFSLFKKKIRQLNENLHEIFKAFFFQCEDRNVNTYVERAQSLLNKLVCLNRKN